MSALSMRSRMLFFVMVAIQIAIGSTATNGPARCGDTSTVETLADDDLKFIDFAWGFVGDIHHYKPEAKMHCMPL